MAATLGATSLAGCNNGGGHTHAYKEVEGSREEATCVKEGKVTKKCVCGQAYDEILPINPDAHEFDDDWTVDPMPSDATEGKATRTCKHYGEAEDKDKPNHKVEVVLPKLTEKEKYLDVNDTKRPTIISEGIRRYVFEHPAGNVTFDIKLPKHDKIEGIEDVVALAASLQETIRLSSGNYIYGDPNGNDVRTNQFSNYYGDNYVRVHDGGNDRDFWYSRDDSGKPFGISAEVRTIVTNEPDDPANPPAGWEPVLGEERRDPKIDESVTEQDLLGFGYASGGGMQMTYGAEDTLLKYYEASQSRGAIKYDDSYELQPDGGYIGSFEFSRKEQVHFCRYYVDFTTFPSGAIKTLSVRTKIIRAFMLANTYEGLPNTVGETVFDEDGDIIFGEIYPIGSDGSEQYETNYEYELNDDGTVRYDYVYEYEVDETRPDRPIKYDEEGDPVIKKDDKGNPVYVLDEDGNPKREPVKKYEYEYETDENGKYVLDENGEKIFAKDNNGAKIKHPIIGEPAIFVSGYKTKPDGTPLLDKNGKQIARPIPLGKTESDEREYYYEAGDKRPDGSLYEEDHEYIAIRTVNFSQTLKVAGETVESNPYPAESVYIRSFDVMYKGSAVTESDVIEIDANTGVEFAIANVLPADTAKLEFDPLRIFLKTATGEIELNYTGNSEDFNQNAYHIIGHFNREKKTVLINARNSGNLTIILRTLSGKCERELKLNVKPGKPSKLNAQAYLYSDVKGTEEHIWTDIEYKAGDPDTYITLYEGQSVFVRGLAIDTEASYVDASFVTALTSGDETSPYITMENGLELPDGTKVSKITAVKRNPSSGCIGVYINSIYSSGNRPVAYKEIGIKVISAPTVDDMFSGSYKGRFGGIRMVANGSPVPADVTVTFNPSSSTEGKINIDVAAGSSKASSVYTYTYNTETGAFTCKYESGRTDESFRFEFAINEVYKLTITHPTYTGRTETIVLSRPAN